MPRLTHPAGRRARLHVGPRARAARAPWRGALALLASVLLAGCTSSSGGVATGACAPTVEGVSPQDYPDARAAREAFTRVDTSGEMEAVLEDVAWLRHEGDEETVIRKHRAYFEQGYTTFVVTLRTKEFVQPTAEQFLLTDSRGATLPGRPLTYAGTMGQEAERFAARFSLSFRHVITRDVGWLRLKRLSTGAELVWNFPWGTPPAGRAEPLAAPPNLLRTPAPGEPAAASPAEPLAPARALPTPSAPAPRGASTGGEAWSAPPPVGPSPVAPAGAAPPVPAAPAAPVAPGALPGPAIRRR